MVEQIEAYCAGLGLRAVRNEDGSTLAIARPGGRPPITVVWRAQSQTLMVMGPLALLVPQGRRPQVLAVINGVNARALRGALVLNAAGRVYFRLTADGQVPAERFAAMLEVVVATVDAVRGDVEAAAKGA